MHSARLIAPAAEEAAAAAVPAHLSPISYADLKVGAKWAMPPELAPPNKFHEGPSGASRMQENLLAAGARLGAYSAPQTS